jgi:aminoglycoside phosphotransferase family enzyme
VHRVVSILPGSEIELGAKVAFLSRADAYSPRVNEVVRRETHMSWVFLAGDKVFKLKKPVCLPYLDFSTLAKREAACRAELRLNSRLAQDVYLDVAPLKLSARGFSVGGEKGSVVDWLVVMRGRHRRRRRSPRLSLTAASTSCCRSHLLSSAMQCTNYDAHRAWIGRNDPLSLA